MVCLLISAPICQGTIKHVMQQCGGRAHNVDIVLVAQISIFTQTMGTGGLAGCVCECVCVCVGGGETSEQKKKKEKDFFYNSHQSHQNTK